MVWGIELGRQINMYNMRCLLWVQFMEYHALCYGPLKVAQVTNVPLCIVSCNNLECKQQIIKDSIIMRKQVCMTTNPHLDLRKCLFNWIQVGGVGRKKLQSNACIEA